MQRIYRAIFIALFAIASVTFGVSLYTFYRMLGRGATTKECSMPRYRKGHDNFMQAGAKEVWCKAEDGVNLSGYFIKRSRSRGVVVMCHGFHRSKEALGYFLPLFKEYDIVAFDFRAHGASGGHYSSIGCCEYKDVRAAATFLDEQGLASSASYKRYIFGISMGASAAIKAASVTPQLADGFILDSPYACLIDEMRHMFSEYSGLPFFPFYHWLQVLLYAAWGKEMWDMKPWRYVEQVKAPMLLIHSATDSFTLPEHSVRIFATAASHNPTCYLWITPPAPHAQGYKYHPQEYAEHVNRFFARCRSGKK